MTRRRLGLNYLLARGQCEYLNQEPQICFIARCCGGSQGSIPMWSCGKSCGESIPKMIRPSKVSTSERQFRHVVAAFLGRGR